MTGSGRDRYLQDLDDAVNVAKGKPSSVEAAPVRTPVATHTATQAPLGANESAPFDDEAT